MKFNISIFILTVALVLSVLANVIVIRSSLNSYESAYADLARQYLKNSEVLAHIESADIVKAREMLESDVTDMGVLLAICLQEHCSQRAAEIMGSSNAH